MRTVKATRSQVQAWAREGRVEVTMEPNQKRIHALKAVVDGGDDGKPVITIMLPEED